MRRRTLLASSFAATLARPAILRAEAATTLKVVPYADLALLDPVVSAFITRNHVLMVFDTLFGMDEAGTVQPQMVEGTTTEADGLTWTLTLRPGLAACCLRQTPSHPTNPREKNLSERFTADGCRHCCCGCLRS